MKLVVGLGNPGRRYAATRHNVGFHVLERFAERHRIALDEDRFDGRFGSGTLRPGVDVALLEPQTWMNLSGDSVVQALRGLDDVSVEDLLVVFDDVDLPLGRLRIRPGGGGGGHKGLSHIIERLGRSDFPRLRFGVGRPPDSVDTADYVLQPFAAHEAREVAARVDEAAAAVEVVLREGVPPAMNRFNPAAGVED